MDLFPSNVKLLSTQRFVHGGRSSHNFANFNLALHVSDSKKNVIVNYSINRHNPFHQEGWVGKVR